jgi:hypothetical protein
MLACSDFALRRAHLDWYKKAENRDFVGARTLACSQSRASALQGAATPDRRYGCELCNLGQIEQLADVTA